MLNSVVKLAVGADIVSEYTIKRSRFLTRLRRVSDEDAARDFIAEVRHTYPDARHHCSAFILEVPGNNQIERSSDDGEPAGTAGAPMLEVLRAAHINDVCAVVTRWFGGIKLGTGGLVRAYAKGVQDALKIAPLVGLKYFELVEVHIPHENAGKIEALLRAREIVIHDVQYGPDVKFTLATQDSASLNEILAQNTSGRAQPISRGQTVVEYPL